MFSEEFLYDSHTLVEVEKLSDALGCRILRAEFMNVPAGGARQGRYAFVAGKR